MESGYGSYGRSSHAAGQTSATSASVFVGGLAFSATEDDLRQALSAAGRIVSCRIVTDRDTGRSKGFGFVDFESEGDRDNAIRNFNGIDICGRPIRLDAGSRGKGSNAGGKGFGGRGNEYNRSGGDGARGYESRHGGQNAPAQQSSYGTGGYSRYPESQSRDSAQGSTSAYQSSTVNYRRDNDQQTGFRSGGFGGNQGGFQSGGYRQEHNTNYGNDRGRAQAYGGGDEGRDRHQPRQTWGHGSSRPHDDWKRDQGRYGGSGRDRSRSRERSVSVSSSALERRQRERQSRKEKFAAQNSAGWDRAPNQDEIAQQEAERAAVRAAEATGKDITTIRADLLKQAQWQQQHSGPY
jgi:heterogeneous nuclear ribonucleoprotein A1/A3